MLVIVSTRMVFIGDGNRVLSFACGIFCFFLLLETKRGRPMERNNMCFITTNKEWSLNKGGTLYCIATCYLLIPSP
jgi:hypothetical protein